MQETIYINEKQVSKLTSFALSTLRNGRSNNKLFPFYKVGRSVRYKLEDVINFMEQHRIETN